MNSTIPLGTAVRVANGEPRPADRFTRKVANWEKNNFSGIYLGEYEGHRLIQAFGKSLKQLGRAVFIRWLSPTQELSAIDPEAPLFPVLTPGEPVGATQLLESQRQRLRVTTHPSLGLLQVHAFLEDPNLCGADLCLKHAEDLIHNTELLVEIPERYRALGHTLGRRCPRTGRGIYFETVDQAPPVEHQAA